MALIGDTIRTPLAIDGGTPAMEMVRTSAAPAPKPSRLLIEVDAIGQNAPELDTMPQISPIGVGYDRDIFEEEAHQIHNRPPVSIISQGDNVYEAITAAEGKNPDGSLITPPRTYEEEAGNVYAMAGFFGWFGRVFKNPYVQYGVAGLTVAGIAYSVFNHNTKERA